MHKEMKYLMLALTMSILWVSMSGIYNYKGENDYIFGLNVFPLVLWTFGRVTVRMSYDSQNGQRFIKTAVIYVIGLLAIEAVGYHFLKIQLNSGFSGIFGLDILHVPLYAKIYYLTAGPVYLALTKLLWGDP